MFHWIENWLRSRNFQTALLRQDWRQAKQLFKVIEQSGQRLSLLEKSFKQRIQLEKQLLTLTNENSTLSNKLDACLSQRRQTIISDLAFIKHVYHSFQLVKLDPYLVKVTGLETDVFYDLEKNLTNFVDSEVQNFAEKMSAQDFQSKLKEAMNDLEEIKYGVNLEYCQSLTPYVYFIKYFLDNVYHGYLAWFLLYEAGLLTSQINILDISAGTGTVAYGLALMLLSASKYQRLPQPHVCYCSLEQQAALQYRGLQFWRRYIQQKPFSFNTYTYFETVDILNFKSYTEKIVDHFFDFIVLANFCFFPPQKRLEVYEIYKHIFQSKLTTNGHILIIVKGTQLFNTYNISQSEYSGQEQVVIDIFLEELGLKLEWYKYLSSTGKRMPMGLEFAQFAKDTLPPQPYMSNLRKRYLKEPFIANYKIDDYIILAKPIS